MSIKHFLFQFTCFPYQSSEDLPAYYSLTSFSKTETLINRWPQVILMAFSYPPPSFLSCGPLCDKVSAALVRPIHYRPEGADKSYYQACFSAQTCSPQHGEEHPSNPAACFKIRPNTWLFQQGEARLVTEGSLKKLPYQWPGSQHALHRAPERGHLGGRIMRGSSESETGVDCS